MSYRELSNRVSGVIFWLMLLGALVSHGILRNSPLDGRGSAAFLFVGAVYVLTGSRNWTRLLLGGVLGFCSEIAGVHSDFLFGRYEYTPVLAPSVFSAPLAMIGAWLLLLGYARQISESLVNGKLARYLMTAVLMVAMDVVIDPLAAHPLNFWKWLEDGPYYGIPLRNFLGWFGVTMVISLVDGILFKGQWQRSAVEVISGQGVMVMYTVAAWSYGYHVPGIIGVIWLVLEGIRTRGKEWKVLIPVAQGRNN